MAPQSPSKSSKSSRAAKGYADTTAMSKGLYYLTDLTTEQDDCAGIQMVGGMIVA
jgi:hypothetical protein